MCLVSSYRNFIHFSSHIKVGITSSGKSFSIGFVFLPGESAYDYIWALQRFYNIGIRPGVVVMDGDDAIKNASETVYPGVPTMLCTWHVNQRVLAYCKTVLEDDWDGFNSLWYSVIQSPSVGDYEERWREMCDTYTTDVS